MERAQAMPPKKEGQLRACDLHQGRVLGCVRQFSWFSEENIQRFLQTEVAKKFERVLEDAGVYKVNKEGRAGFERFIKEL